MPALVTTEFRIHNAKQFREMFSEAAQYGGATASAALSTNMYLFIGKSAAWSGSYNDGTTDSPNSSQIGYLLADEGQIDLDGANDAHQLAVTEATQRQVSGVTNNILTFNRPFDYKGVPYTQHPNNQGFGLYKHKVDQRVLAA